MLPLTDDDKKWLHDHRHADPRSLYLKYHGDAAMTRLVEQLECRRKAATKLTGWPMSDDFIFPNALAVEQCTGTDLAALHSMLITEGETVMDMTCGLAIDALHLCRRAATVTTFDLKPDNIAAALINASAAGIGNLIAECGDSVEHLKDYGGRYDTVFVDPSRRDATGHRTYALSACSPDIPALLPLISTKTDRLIIKCSPMLDISQTIAELHAAHPAHIDINIYGTVHDCKEVVAIMDFTRPGGDPAIRCITPGHDDFTFTAAQENRTTTTYATPAVGDYLYEPYPAILKGGPFRLFATRHGLDKLSASSHIYHSSRAITAPQTRRWIVERIMPFDKSSIRSLSSLYPHINVATRNFIMTADELRKRLKVKEGSGSHKLWGTTAADGTRLLIIASSRD